jgi:wyosine [tRNA(Phe)-imidazoG37] synthetase (radical SAM superfamily)
MAIDRDYLPLQSGIIYGPVASRRLGPSLGINLLPFDYKLCTFNCVYCQYGPTKICGYAGRPRDNERLPSVNDVEDALRSVLRLYPDVNYITFSGNGEATLHPQFAEIVGRVVNARDRLSPRARVAILTSSGTIESPEIRAALSQVDLPIMKLDAGTKWLFQHINRPHPEVRFENVIKGLTEFEHPNLTIQSMFFSGQPTNTEDGSVEAWARQLREIRPREVQMYTVQRPPAESGIFTLADPILHKIAERAEMIAGVPIRVY